MSRRFAANSKVAFGSHQAVAEVMLPNSIDDHACQQRSATLFDVGDPIGQRATLQACCLRSPCDCLCFGPILLGIATVRTGSLGNPTSPRSRDRRNRCVERARSCELRNRSL